MKKSNKNWQKGVWGEVLGLGVAGILGAGLVGAQPQATKADLDKIDPLQNSTVLPGEVSIGAIIGRFLTFLYPIVIILLFGLLLWGGIEFMMGGVNAKSDAAANAKKRIMAALMGFAMVMLSWLIIMVIQWIFKIDIIQF